MSEQILKVEPDPRDENCFQITLRHVPKKYRFWRSSEPKVVIYKGYHNDWYCFPSFQPAPSSLIPLLKAISYGPQFKHLHFKHSHLKQQLPSY